VLEASTALNETCGACHTAHRVRLDDGTYEIKTK
jgi:ribosomal protein L32